MAGIPLTGSSFQFIKETEFRWYHQRKLAGIENTKTVTTNKISADIQQSMLLVLHCGEDSICYSMYTKHFITDRIV